MILISDATLELEDKYQRTVNEIEALKDHLGKRFPFFTCDMIYV